MSVRLESIITDRFCSFVKRQIEVVVIAPCVEGDDINLWYSHT